MLYILAIAAGIAAGVLAGGKVSNLLTFRLRWYWVILLVFILETGMNIIIRQLPAAAGKISLVAYGLRYCLLLIGFWMNRRYLGIVTIGSGCFLNALVIMLNGGKMPVSTELLEQKGLVEAARLLESGLDSKHAVLAENTKLAFLADVIYLPYFPGFLMRIVSLGDLLIAAGLFVLVFEIVGRRNGGFIYEKAD